MKLAHYNSASDFRRSLEARLQNEARKQMLDLQRLRRKVAFERFLARVFSVEHSQFALKGGYAMELRFRSARATKDIDLTSLHRSPSEDLNLNNLITKELEQLILVDLGDYFNFELSAPKRDLTNAPYGGARFSVQSFIDARSFVQFQLDVGGDSIIDHVEKIEGTNWLHFCGIEPAKIEMISIEQQLAEKLHAYTLARGNDMNTRVKDLIDMVLLIQTKHIDIKHLRKSINHVFALRKTHPIPEIIEFPPERWREHYAILAQECDLKLTMDEAYQFIKKFFCSLGEEKYKPITIK